MKYEIFNSIEVNEVLFGGESAKLNPIAISISDLVLANEACLIWLVKERFWKRLIESPEKINDWALTKYPLAANYHNTGSSDINRKIMMQDPINNLGPYVLDRLDEPENKTFIRKNLSIGGEPRISRGHTASDKILFESRFYFVGDQAEMFEEIRNNGYIFQD